MNPPKNIERQNTAPDKREHLLSDVATEQSRRIAEIANDPVLLKEHMIDAQHKRLDDLQRQVDNNRDIVGMRDTFRQAFRNQPREAEVLESIIQGITTPTPHYGQNVRPEHRYLRNSCTTVSDSPIDMYSIRHRVVGNDLEHLKQLITTIDEQDPANPVIPPEIAHNLSELREALMAYSWQDREAASKILYKENHPEHYTDQVVGKFGTMALFLGASASALVLGAMTLGSSWKSKKFQFPTGGLLAGGVALLALPNMRKTLFGGEREQALTEVDKAINNPDAKKLGRNVAGPGWRHAAHDTMEHAPYVNNFRSNMRNGETTPQEIAQVAKKLAPGDIGAQKTIVEMATAGTLETFLASMDNVQDKDAQTFVMDYYESNAAMRA